MAPVHYILPRWAPMAAITLFGSIYAKRDIAPWDLRHEEVHVAQQARDGWRFYLRYIFLPSWRARYEAEAYAEQARAGCIVAQLARLIASWLYLWPCSASTAEKLIRSHLETP